MQYVNWNRAIDTRLRLDVELNEWLRNKSGDRTLLRIEGGGLSEIFCTFSA